jgi:uncharacterized BrkB/YihY/UPF0761 family membrane protein
MWLLAMILPIVFFIISVVITVFNMIKAVEVQISIWGVISSCLIFIVANIPTVIFVVMLIHYKKPDQQKKEFSNSKIADL